MLKIQKKIILLLGDLAVLHLALFSTLALRYPNHLRQENWHSHWPEFWPVFLIWLMLLYINDLYNLNYAGNGEKFYRGLLSASALSTILSALYFYLNFNSPVAPKTNLALFTLVFILIFYLWRRLYRSTLRHFIPLEPVAIISPQKEGQYLLEALRKHPGDAYQAGPILDPNMETGHLIEQINHHQLRNLVIFEHSLSAEKLNQLLEACWRHDIKIFNYANFYEDLSGQIPLEAISPSWFLSNIQTKQKEYFHYFKQGLDLILALMILLVSLPLWPAIALLIKTTSPGKVFFRQERLGRDGKIFTIIKFRTMQPVTEELGQMKIIAGGKFLRQTRLDELPQVINILKGEMSFIGPRPERPTIAAGLEKLIPFYRLRLLIKPGLTGWDQISGVYRSASESDSRTKLQHDLYYLKHRSLYLDLSITLKTIATIISRSGQ